MYFTIFVIITPTYYPSSPNIILCIVFIFFLKQDYILNKTIRSFDYSWMASFLRNAKSRIHRYKKDNNINTIIYISLCRQIIFSKKLQQQKYTKYNVTYYTNYLCNLYFWVTLQLYNILYYEYRTAQIKKKTFNIL